MSAAGRKIALIHDWLTGMGFNRSGLVAGLILKALGVSGTAAVTRIRERRPGALFNDRFAEYLVGVEAGTIGD